MILAVGGGMIIAVDPHASNGTCVAAKELLADGA